MVTTPFSREGENCVKWRRRRQLTKPKNRRRGLVTFLFFTSFARSLLE